SIEQLVSPRALGEQLAVGIGHAPEPSEDTAAARGRLRHLNGHRIGSVEIALRSAELDGHGARGKPCAADSVAQVCGDFEREARVAPVVARAVKVSNRNQDAFERNDSQLWLSVRWPADDATSLHKRDSGQIAPRRFLAPEACARNDR